MQEVHDITRFLIDRRFGAVLVGDGIVAQWRRHLDDATRHVRVVVGTGRDGNIVRCFLTVAGEDRVDVVRPVLARFDQQALIRRRGTVVGGAGGFLIGVGAGEFIRRQAGTVEHLTRVVRAVMDLVAGREGLHFRRTETDILKRAERHAFQAVAGRADFLVHLQAALDRLLVELAEGTVERPVDLLGFGGIAMGKCTARQHHPRR